MEVLKVVFFISLIFGILVGIHELGHFLMAKTFGVWVQEFAIGFGPNIYKKQYKDTLYKINAIPFGGYVRLYGEQDFTNVIDGEYSDLNKKLNKLIEEHKLYYTPEDELESNVDMLEISAEEKSNLIVLSLKHPKRKSDSRRYINKPIYARILIVLGGILMNFLLGVLTYSIYLLLIGTSVVLPKIGEYRFLGNNTEVINAPIITFVGNSDQEDLLNSVVVKIDDEYISNANQFTAILEEKWNQELNVVYYKDGNFQNGKFKFSGKYDTFYSQGLVNKVVVTSVLENSPAFNGGIKIEDVILEINQESFDSEEEFSALLDKYAGQTVEFMIFRPLNKGLLSLQIALNVPQNEDERILGTGYFVNEPYGVELYIIEYPNAFVGGLQHSLNILGYQIQVTSKLIGDSFSQKDVSIVGDNVSGPIRIGSEIARMVQTNNFIDLLNLFGLISLALAFMNVLPLPVVDGGHIVLLILEKIRGRGLSISSQNIYNIVGFVFIVVLSLLITIKDVFQVFWGS